MFKVISDIMAHWYEKWSTFFGNLLRRWKEHELCIDVYHSNHYGIKCLCNSQIEPYNDIFKVISDIMAHSYEIWNIIITAINFCIAKKMNVWN